MRHSVISIVQNTTTEIFPLDDDVPFEHCSHIDLDSVLMMDFVSTSALPIPPVISNFRPQSTFKLTFNGHIRIRVLSSVPQSIQTVITERAPSDDGNYGLVTSNGRKLFDGQTYHAQIGTSAINGWKPCNNTGHHGSNAQRMPVGFPKRLFASSKLYNNLVPLKRHQQTKSNVHNQSAQQPRNPNTESEVKLPGIYIHNIRSLNNEKFEELKLLAHEHDIIVLTESWLTAAKEKLYNIDGFSLYACNRKGRIGGGVAVFVRNTYPVTKLCAYTNAQVSAYWFLLQQPNQPPIIFGSIYSPPGLLKRQSDATIDHILSTLAKYTKSHKSAKIFLSGDFNDLNTAEITNLYPLEQIVNFPTRDNNTLDLVFTDIDEYQAGGCKQEPPILTNDHCSIAITSTVRSSRPKYQTIKKRIITPTAKIALTEELLSIPWRNIQDMNNIDQMVEFLHSTINTLYDKHCPEKNVRVPVGKPYISSPLMRKLKRAKQNAYKNNNIAWKFLSKQLAALQKSALHKMTNETINESIQGSKRWWHNVKKLTGDKHVTNQPAVMFMEDTWLSTEEFVNKLNSYYVQDHNEVVFPEIPSGGIPISVTEMEVFKFLEDIDTHKATSSEDYASWISKNNMHILCEPITHIVNTILSTGEYPKMWKQAEVSPIPKTKNVTQYKDMRPISLLFHIGKIAEKIIAKHLRAELPDMPNQYAYTPTIGTTDALVKFTTDIVNSLDDKDCVAVRSLMLDFSKAFDRMRPEIAVNKLLNLNINSNTARLIRSFLTERKQCVRYGGHFSPYLQSHIGVPQGTILGPLLWNIYINDLRPNAHHIKYADDSTIYSSINKSDVNITNASSHKATVSMSTDPLQDAANYATSWCDQNSMLLNASKSSSITFTLQKKIDIDPILINETEVSDDVSTKLLGVTYDQHLKFSKHVDTIIDKCRPAFHAMSKLRKAGVDDAGLTMFYKSRIVPLIIYAAPSWYPLLSVTDKERLEKYQRHCLRMIYPYLDDTNSRLCQSGLDDIGVQLSIQCLRYTARLRSNKTHPLHNYTDTGSRLSARSGRTVTSRTRTSLAGKSLFRQYS